MRSWLIGALWCFAMGNSAQAAPKIPQSTAVLHDALEHLERSMTQYSKAQLDLQLAKALLSEGILSNDDLVKTKGRVSMDQDNLSRLSHGMRDDILYLKAHWGELTGIQRDQVDKDQENLE